MKKLACGNLQSLAPQKADTHGSRHYYNGWKSLAKVNGVKEKLAIWKAKLKAWKLQAGALWRDREVIKTEIRALIAAFPLARDVVSNLSATEFFGPTKTQIAWQRVRYELILKGHNVDDLTGAIIFAAIAFAYLYQIKGIGKVS